MPQGTGDSLLSSSGFDSGLDGWQPYNGSSTLVNDNGRLKVSASVVWGTVKKPLTLETGKQYRVRFTIDIGNCHNLSVPVYKSDISSYVGLQGIQPVTSSGTYEGTFTATSNSMLLLFEMIPTGNPPPDSTGYFWLDDVTVEEIKPGGGGTSGSEGGYRYSINGQEKSPEIAPNTTTAPYWGYDSRIGRRWNVDIIKKPWQNVYTTFSNNPVWRIDPNGDDDYFNSKGQLIKQTKTGSKIFVQTDKGNLLLTQININSATNRQTVANIVGYYANKVGIVYQPKGSSQNRGNGIVGLGWGNKDPEVNPAYTINPSKDILINKKGNKINSSFSDYYNLENTLIHEKSHKTNIENKVVENIQTHIDVYLGQIKDETFRKGTSSYQEGIIGSLSNYLLNYYTDFTNGETDQLEKYVADFNKNNKVGYLIQVDVATGSERGYKVNIFKNKKLTGTINYSKIKDEQGDN